MRKKTKSLKALIQMRVLRPVIGRLFLSLALTACVTVNVNFPESAVQKASDDYVKDLYQESVTPAPSAKPDGAKHSALSLIAEAQADELFKIDTSTAREIKENLRSRVSEVIEQKRRGVFGEGSDGMLVLKDSSKLNPLLLQKLKSVIAAENKDRAELYAEVLKANQLPEARLPNVEKSFARSFQAESPSGSWVQESGGGWAKKP